MSKVLVLTSVELGWDCVCGVFDSEEGALIYLNEDEDMNEDRKYYEGIGYVFHAGLEVQ